MLCHKPNQKGRSHACRHDMTPGQVIDNMLTLSCQSSSRSSEGCVGSNETSTEGKSKTWCRIGLPAAHLKILWQRRDQMLHEGCGLVIAAGAVVDDRTERVHRQTPLDVSRLRFLRADSVSHVEIMMHLYHIQRVGTSSANELHPVSMRLQLL